MTIFETILAGIVGTVGMTLLMTLIHRAGWANADMIRALGSCLTRSYDNALKPGLLMHFASGALFAFPYALVISGVALQSIAAAVGLGLLMGFVHGFVISFVMVAVVSDKHPVPRFQTAGFEVAAAHVVGHMAYGAGVGAMIGLLGISFGFRF
ncbi:MAG: hypothetical protein OEN01_13335 [Candidatus Krumholzibacteria bacterium]|nr:hypothetical protein [Candidatus Krumholzibacteria bacterium]